MSTSSSSSAPSSATVGGAWRHNGWLETKTLRSGWKKTWVEVVGGVLHLYDDQAETTRSRIGSVDLRKHCSGVEHSTCATAAEGEIELVSTERTYRLQCGSDQAAEQWIASIRAYMAGMEIKPRPTRRAASTKPAKRPGGKAPKHPWTPDEDQLLVRLIQEHGPNRWAHIAGCIPGRVGKQCRERWQNHLNPDVNRAAEWSEEEESALFRWHDELGNKWADIAKHLPGRTDNSVKNYWHKRVGQLKRGAPAARPKKAIDKKKSIDNGRQALAALERQTSGGSTSSVGSLSSLALEPTGMVTVPMSESPRARPAGLGGAAPMDVALDTSADKGRAARASAPRRGRRPSSSSSLSSSSSAAALVMDSPSRPVSPVERAPFSSAASSGAATQLGRASSADAGRWSSSVGAGWACPGNGEVLNNSTNLSGPPLLGTYGGGISQATAAWPRLSGALTRGGSGGRAQALLRGPWSVGDGTSFDALSVMPTDCSVLPLNCGGSSKPTTTTNNNIFGPSSSSCTLQPMCGSGSWDGSATDMSRDEDMLDLARSPALTLGSGFFGVSPAPRPYSALSCSSGFASPHPLSSFGSPSTAGLSC